jgi:hypothetical protein
MSLTQHVDEAEAFKALGNERFMQGDVRSAIAAYRSGIECANLAIAASSEVGISTTAAALRAVLCSNCSHALSESGAYDDAVEVAREGVTSDPTMKKGWLRLVRALHLSRNTFEAFVTLHAHLAPGLSLKELGALCGPLSDAVADGVGVSGLHTAFQLAADESGGVSTVASGVVREGQVLFVERRWDHPHLAASATANVDNDAHLMHFTQQLIALLAASKDGGASDSHSAQAWNEVNRALAGSWPRRLEDVPPQQQAVAAAVVLKVLSSGSSRIKADTFTAREMSSIAHLALICRYSCFHSGFFRACALLNHSCHPNAAMKFVQRDQSVHMLVVSNIKPGDAITVKYLTDADYLEGVGRRRELLWNSWLFWCTCQRCMLDDLPTATCEHRRCSSGTCTQYVHCPTPGAESSVGCVGAGPERKCDACGTVAQWTTEERDCIYRARTKAAQLEGDISSISAQVAQLQCDVAPLVHSDHWIHRVILYYYGVNATQVIGHWFQGLLSESLAMSAVAPLAFKNFSVSVGDAMTGEGSGGLLAALLDLWRRIVPFYPWNEGWALHCAIVRLLVINLCCPSHPNVLPEDAVVERLGVHAPFIGKQEQSSCLKLLQSFRGSDKSATKLMKTVKKLLS